MKTTAENGGPPAGEMQKPKVESRQHGLENAHSALFTYGFMTLALMLCPPFVLALWYTMAESDGSIPRAVRVFGRREGSAGVFDVWPRPTWLALKFILAFGAFEACLQVLLPGERYEGPLSPTGHRPVYKRNGVSAYLITLGFYVTLWKSRMFNPGLVYDNLGSILSTLIFGSLAVCTLLYVKGHLAPSSTDSGTSGNVLIDFYWGMELYPRIGSTFDIKQFTNCRFGMMSWGVLVVTYCIKQVEIYGTLSNSLLVSSLLMLVYIGKFFWWEPGYMASMDIAHDRAGFYIVWGCLVWVPCIYTSPALYLVKRNIELDPVMALSIALSGLICIYVNYDCDRQRQVFRRSGGREKIWGRAPQKIVAQYTTEDGEQKQSMLLTSGWWGVARHFHYVPEIMASFFWSVPALFYNFSPYFYTVYLTILLFDRAIRDDQRCRAKYQKYWLRYCERVKYVIIPGVY